MVTNPDMLWLVITSGIACFFMAFVTGANDIANTFSTSIGSKAISVKKAIIVAFFFEALGASLLGGTVTDSIRSKIINFEVFYDAPEFLMLGMCCALMGATVWLAVATFAGIPVSTTHSIIGALMGFGLATGNKKSIKWEKIHSIVISWFAAPLLAGTCSALAFSLLRILILRRNNSFSIIKRSYWFLIFLITLPFSVFLVFQNPIVLDIRCTMLKDDIIVISSPCYLQDWSAAHVLYSLFICLGISIFLTCVSSFIIYVIYRNRIRDYHLKKKIYGDEMIDLEKNDKGNFCNVKNSSLNSVASNETQGTQSNARIPSEIIEKKKDDHEKDFQNIINIKKINFKNDIIDDKKSLENNNLPEILIENFDPETEIVFSSLQIISAILGVVAQSANDTANAIGPFAAVFNTYNNGIKGKIKVQWYILLFGGLSMSLGLSLLGYKVIKTVGMKLIKITPSRGFTVELISGLIVLFFSICGIPLSSTHCAVSSVIGVGLVEAKISANKRKNLKILDDSIDVDKEKNFSKIKKKKFSLSFLNTSCVNLKLFRTVFLSWIITVFFSASVTAAIFSFAAYSPSYKF
ncbi:sodium-dependent phosphate transporter, putative [Plasmodium gallinaceum]|uniref:Phosphate transporter n=1 Tax=Plasmodium gallinaceum TaxID=5849 RepID=A0A1J1GS64_PLAGA|nr:sodium-dependent phosphate transporter, putative [Plasmodium gallinaceum]XP_028527931.1 sodium-dependent phosphate transporter, putative [Plasmodium gallinaceum]CRG95117.1 sodium-dependent phosphate transporter, putative [Plasmodium gallinaceum]CRG95118.1 sodium-dependent phosphate transporter, putative [Plasmodium gallinaceum]